MTSSEATPARRFTRDERADRVLDTAQRLFYARGVHEVGMDELVRESGLAKASVYRLFATKDALVAAYLRRLADAIFAAIDADIAQHSGRPDRALMSVLDAVRADLHRPGFRGCPFNNASIEFEDVQHPARVEARRYREELAARLVALGTALAGRRQGRVLGAELAVLIDGAYTHAAHAGAGGPADDGLRLARRLVRDAARSATASR